jgi:hypothetical protein
MDTNALIEEWGEQQRVGFDRSTEHWGDTQERRDRREKQREAIIKWMAELRIVAALPGPFFVFAWNAHNACGGIHDFVCTVSTFEEATRVKIGDYEYRQIAALDGDKFVGAEW